MCAFVVFKHKEAHYKCLYNNNNNNNEFATFSTGEFMFVSNGFCIR